MFDDIKLLGAEGRFKASAGMVGSILLASLFPIDPDVRDFIFKVHDVELSRSWFLRKHGRTCILVTIYVMTSIGPS